MGNRSSTSVSNSPRGIGDWFRDAGVRETVESVIVAVMLALLFKAFEAEAFVIPTGSMAPTLQGQHKDVVCPKCGFRYRVNASVESREPKSIVATTCPICRYTQRLNSKTNWNQDTFSGDRILVSKFAYDIAEPNRWDVIVFRYPKNAKQNYIKRLVGLPNERLLIESGDLHVWNPPEDAPEALPDDRSQFSIVRKPPRKLLSMLQLVDDTKYLAPELVEVDWPLRWQEWSATSDQKTWTADLSPDGPFYTIAKTPELNWLRYRHLVPRRTEWTEISAGRLPKRMNNPLGELISDYYEYNDYGVKDLTKYGRNKVYYSEPIPHWVGDLVLDANIKLDSNEGTLFLQCLEGGIKFTCAIDVKTGAATVESDSEQVRFDQADGSEGSPSTVAKGQTSVRGGRSYRVRYGNVDDRIYLWINNRAVEFDLPMTFRREGPVLPKWSSSNPRDAEPLGIGAQNLSMSVDRLRVWRDIYYIGSLGVPPSDYKKNKIWARDILQTPERWATDQAEAMFLSRERKPTDSFLLLDDQFFALGDNSPASSDARAWVGHHYVERENLVGKALFVYWPHSWWSPIPFLPNFKRMGFIR